MLTGAPLLITDRRPCQYTLRDLGTVSCFDGLAGRTSRVVAARSEICHLKTFSEAPFDLLYFRNAWSHDQEVIDVHGDVHIAPDENPKISADWLEPKIP